MPSLAAESAAEAFYSWLEARIADQEERKRLGRLGDPRFESFDHGWSEWLQTEDGHRSIAADYGLAVESLLMVLSEPGCQETYGLAIASEDGHQWECMTETGFRRLMFLHENRPARS